MVHFTIFSGSELSLLSNCHFVFTLFGGTDVKKPTLAKRIMQEKHLLTSDKSEEKYKDERMEKFIYYINGRSSHSPRRRTTFFLTIFGAVDIKPPSLAEEFMDMRELVASGLITAAEWDQIVGRMYQMGDLDSISSCTLFGGISEEKVEEEEEIKKIQGAKDLGLLNDDETVALQSIVGRDPQQVRMLLRQTAFA